MAQLLDGRIVAQTLLSSVEEDVRTLKSQGILPKLVVVVVGNVAASEVYVNHKIKACQQVGVESEVRAFEESITQEEMVSEIEALNRDESVHGFIVQLPLPAHLEVPKLMKAIDPKKDADGFHAYNMGKMLLDKSFEDLAPCTPKGIIELLNFYKIDVAGMNAVVIGRSNIVGKPMAAMLLNRDATVSICHSRTKNVSSFTKDADLIVVAVGRPGFLTADMVSEKAIVIDVGIHRVDGKLVGDADFASLEPKVKAITPVPGGVGPLTVACLLRNAVTSAKKTSTT